MNFDETQTRSSSGPHYSYRWRFGVHKSDLLTSTKYQVVLGLNYAPPREPPFQEWYGYSGCYASDHLRDVALALLLAREQMLTVLSPVHHPFVWPELKLNDAYRMADVIKQAIQENVWIGCKPLVSRATSRSASRVRIQINIILD